MRSIASALWLFLLLASFLPAAWAAEPPTSGGRAKFKPPVTDQANQHPEIGISPAPKIFSPPAYNSARPWIPMPDDKMEEFEAKRAYYAERKKRKEEAAKKKAQEAAENGEQPPAEPSGPDMRNLNAEPVDEITTHSKKPKPELPEEEESEPSGGIGKVGGLGEVEVKGGEEKDSAPEPDDEGGEEEE
jgi:hypothetical protein